MGTRRQFLGKLMMVLSTLSLGKVVSAQKLPVKKLNSDATCNLYRSINGSPVENLSKVIELMGGIQKVIGPDDIVVIKPNVQWWNQGVPNLSGLMKFVDLIMDRPGGFKGEVVLAENCHRGAKPWKHAGWANQFSRNSD